MRYRRPKKPPRADLDGEFERYQTLDGLPLENDALTLLRRCAFLVGPIMRSHGWAAPLLREMHPDEHWDLLGYNKLRLDSTKKVPIEIALLLREPENMHKLLSINETMRTMLHELTHYDHIDHDLSFYTSNLRLLAELEDDVSKGKLQVKEDELPAFIIVHDAPDMREHFEKDDIKNKGKWTARLVFLIICTVMISVS